MLWVRAAVDYLFLCTEADRGAIALLYNRLSAINLGEHCVCVPTMKITRIMISCFMSVGLLTGSRAKTETLPHPQASTSDVPILARDNRAVPALRSPVSPYRRR